ncbi:hypothetical protein PHIN8_03290 [Polynucleobacter sp. HIN8]|nr:hypothetical protein PHIN8_03290 [Polynucleobacter sp. HIN8]
MAKPFILNNTWFEYGQNEFVFAYSNAVNSAMPQYNLIDPNLITLRKYKTTKKNNTLCIYMGKCRFGLNFKKYISLLDKFDEFVIITRTNPSKREILYECIANSKLLLSFDPLSSICYESTLLGTPVLLGDSVFEAEYKNYNYPLYGFNYSADEIDFYKDEFYYHATDCLDEQISKNTDKTINIINKIESAMIYKKDMLPDLYDMKLSDLNFFNDVWKCSPIYNCTTKNSIFRYHLICNRPILYVFLLQLFRFKLCFISAIKAIIFYFTWSNIKRMMLIYLGLSNDIIYLNYIKNPGVFKIKISPINCEPIDNSSSDAISIKKQTLKKLWNL